MAIPVVVGIVYYGSPLLFLVLVVAVVLAAVCEYFGMIDRTGINGFPIPSLILSFLLLLCFYFDGRFFMEWGLVTGVALFAVWFIKESNVRIAIDQIAYSLFGILYVAGLGGYILLIREFENGGRFLFFLFLIVWLGDIAAYYWGKNFGKKPLAPKISPQKTVEGAVAGLVGSVFAGVVAKIWFLDQISVVHCLLAALVCGIIGQFGDLAESLLKRHAGVKDSSDFIPGHGGVLDRIDSLLFAGPAFYCYFRFVL
ncbi:MAG: phosphatidate cytidylyltransferase [Nitrospinae bacterium]|nr:phosphatidate cytidylyltransferase [Nitrospinota bacterium]